MEFGVLYSYLDWKGKPQKLRKIYNPLMMRIVGWFMISFGIISGVLMGVMLINRNFSSEIYKNVYFWALLGVDILFAFITYTFSQNYDISHSKEKIDKLDDHYRKAHKWLSSIGYSSKNELKLLISQCKGRLRKNQEGNIKAFKIMNYIVGAFVLPIYSAILAINFDEVNSSVSEVVTYSQRIEFFILTGILGVIIYLFIYSVINGVIWLKDGEMRKLQVMIDDVQGVLNRQFPIDDQDIVDSASS